MKKEIISMFAQHYALASNRQKELIKKIISDFCKEKKLSEDELNLEIVDGFLVLNGEFTERVFPSYEDSGFTSMKRITPSTLIHNGIFC